MPHFQKRGSINSRELQTSIIRRGGLVSCWVLHAGLSVNTPCLQDVANINKRLVLGRTQICSLSTQGNRAASLGGGYLSNPLITHLS